MSPSRCSFLDAARRYLGLGWSVFPCRGKIPLCKWETFQSRQPSEEELSEWTRLYPDANIAVVTGAVSGLLVVDSDGDAPPVPMGQTASVRTAKGFHYYFRYPPDRMFKNRVGIGGRKVDVRGEGGYVLAPDSVHPETGQLYTWLIPPEEGVAELPNELAELLSERPQAERAWVSGLEGAEEGKRNDTAASLAGRLLAANPPELWEYAVWGGMQAWNQKNRPPLESEELRRTYESIRDSQARKKGLVKTANRSFADLAAMFDKRYESYDLGTLRVCMAIALANQLTQQDALWVHIVAPASSGKTETIRAFRELPGAEWLSQVTSKTFFSGRGKDYSFAYQLENPALILIEDMTTLFEMPQDERNGVMRTLRLMYSRDFRALSGNVKPGELPDWDKKVSLITGTTQRIDSSDASGMQVVAGSRTLMYRMWVPKRDDPRRITIIKRAIEGGPDDEDARRYLREETRNCYLSLLETKPIEPAATPGQVHRLSLFANMVAMGRHANVRDPRTDEIEQIPEPEMGGRIGKQLALIAKGHALVEQRRELIDADLEAAARVARDTLPELTLTVLECLNDIPRTTDEVTTLAAQRLQKRYPLGAVRHRLEDLAAGGLVFDHAINGGLSKWQHSDQFKEMNRVARLILSVE